MNIPSCFFGYTAKGFDMNRNRQRGSGRRGMQQRRMKTGFRPGQSDSTQQKPGNSTQEFPVLGSSALRNTAAQFLETASRFAEGLHSGKPAAQKQFPPLQSKPLSYPNVNTERCTGCGICADVCPVNAIHIEGVAVVDESVCMGCRRCFEACPRGAITFIESA